MHARALLACFAIAVCAPAGAQPVPNPPLAQKSSVESVTVTGTRDHQVIEEFIQSFAAPTRLAGKIARWEDRVCPATVGLKAGYAKYVTNHLREIATSVGVPVDMDKSCKPNIHIVFTTAPQMLIDGIRKNQKFSLGYYDNEDQLAKLATVSRPIQAWYTTATRDLEGNQEVDGGKTIGTGLEIWLPCNQPPGVCLVTLPNARAFAVTGSRLGDGLHSVLHRVIIVADPTKLKEYEMGTIADYIAMLALTQLNSLETCQQLPSIVNFLAQKCERPANALTDNDTAYLRGLYKMSPGQSLRTQEDEVAYHMEQSIKGR